MSRHKTASTASSTRSSATSFGQWRRHPRFRAFRLNGSNEVYGYEESHSHARIICKFYGPKFGWDRERAARVAYQEHEAMERLRGYDLVGSPHHVIRPLGVDPDTNCVIATEFYKGEPFFHAIRRATHHGDDAHLYWRLKALAYFLATQHNRQRERGDRRLRRRHRVSQVSPVGPAAAQQDRPVGLRRTVVAVGAVADAAPYVERSAGAAARRRHPGEFPVRARSRRRRHRPRTHGPR